jgi:hypothetical protein
MKILVILLMVTLVGCASTEYEFQDVPEHLLHVDDNYVTLEQPILPDNLKKGPFPAG